MANKEQNLDILKANIKRLIKLRGKTLHDLSDEKEVSYTLLSKFLSDKTYTTKKGTICKIDPAHLRRAISDFLEVPYYDLWYKEGNKIVSALIEIEIAKTVRQLVKDNITIRRKK